MPHQDRTGLGFRVTFLLWKGKVCFGRAKSVLEGQSLFWKGKVCLGLLKIAYCR